MPEKNDILVVGVGSIGERHLRCFQANKNARLSLCEINPSLREKISKQYGIDRSFSCLDEAIRVPPDAAVIATPANLHIEIAHRLAESGIHLLIEKPLSTTLKGVESLCHLVDQKQLVAAVAYVYRAHPALAQMKEAIESGRFGKPVQLIAVCGAHFPTHRPAYQETYYRDHATGGGAIQDALTHILNAGEWLVGPIDRLVVDAAHQSLEGVQVEDTVHLLARHGDLLASYSLNQYQAPTENTITVVCQNGTARFEMHSNRWRWMDKSGQPWHDESFEVPQRDTLFMHQANRFLDAVGKRVSPLCSLQEGVQTLRCNLAALASAAHGEWQTIA